MACAAHRLHPLRVSLSRLRSFSSGQRAHFPSQYLRTPQSPTMDPVKADMCRPSLMALRRMSTAVHEPPTALDTLTWPPTADELKKFKDVPLEQLPPTYKREPHERIFVNRNLSLDGIQWIGFDMDYTLAVYRSPIFEAMTYSLLVQQLVASGYPSEVAAWQFDPEFAIRGLFLDTKLGNLLKLDGFNNILTAIYGRRTLTANQVKAQYPSMFIPSDMIGSSRRIQALNTLFDIPKTCVFADLVEYFDNCPSYKPTPCGTGVASAHFVLSYANMVADLGAAIDVVHDKGILKETTLKDIDKYVVKDARLSTLLTRLRGQGKRPFLVTNSGYTYTDAIMRHVLDCRGDRWTDFFDVVIVDARKPLFFGEGSSLREVNQTTGALMLGAVTGGLQMGRIYSGGSSDTFCHLTGATPESILYVGDHIFGDILKSKKKEGWRTFLVVPELAKEIGVWKEQQKHYLHLQNLEFIVAETYRDMDSHCKEKPDTGELVRHITSTAEQLDQAANSHFGSMFRSGSRMSFFAMQTQRYADLYAPSHLNLLSYPFFYDFRAPEQRMPHEDI
eukprot:comp22137_c1_seq1/m.32392 comp22137_c1_seq1/g.32392  ORF comp22137_c1_seq1/g.32392 comp22137_c1_seq1/m.32392 type:complete len:560 (-) comp22137_c1_seq1:271-1950(-)